MPEVDTSRAVAAGASYGGFMISESPFSHQSSIQDN